MISLNDYFGPWDDSPDATAKVRDCAAELLDRVNDLLIEAEAHGVELKTNPATHTLVSGQTLGGFRPQSCKIGSVNSAHKLGRAVDVYDVDEALDNWITDAILLHHGLYREHPSATKKWCHLTDRAPGSGKRTFFP